MIERPEPRARRPEQRVALGCLVATILSSSTLAYAHGEAERDPVVRTRTEEPAGEEAEGDEETRFSVGVDYVIGIGKISAADQLLPGSASVNPINQVDADPVHTNTFVFGFGYEPIKNLGFGVRLPLTVG